jgi:hypothetical protein
VTQVRDDMKKAIRDQAHQIARLRSIPESEATDIVSRSFRENLEDSRGTTMEGYWKLMIEVADDEVAAQLGMVGR